MKTKKIIHWYNYIRVILILLGALSLSTVSVGASVVDFESENCPYIGQNDFKEEENVSDDELDNYDVITVFEIDNTSMERIGTSDLVRRKNIEKAIEGVKKLHLMEKGYGYIEDACLSELKAYGDEDECVLTKYSVLIPQSASSTPAYYTTYMGRAYYSSITSLSNITIQKNNSFGSSTKIASWAQNVASLVLCFNSDVALSIAWSLITGSYPSGYTYHTTDWMESYINLNPYNRAIYAKNGNQYINLANREYGDVRPYFVYHYNDATSPNPTMTVSASMRQYLDVNSTNNSSLLYIAKQVYDTGANAVTFKLKNAVKLEWQ